MPGVQELLVIAVVALLVFGPERLPEIARTAARAVTRFRAETERNLAELRRAAEIDDLEEQLREVRQDLRSTTNTLRSGVSRSLDPRNLDPANAARAAGGPTERLRADDDPPPFDPQAT